MSNFISNGVFSEAELVVNRMRQFHRERVEAVQKDQLHVRLNDPSRLVIHLIPEQAVRAPTCLSAMDLKRAADSIRPLGQRHGGYKDGRYNADGYLLYIGLDSAQSYSQLYRNGVYEGVMAETVYQNQDRTKLFRANVCEEAILGAVSGYLSFANKLGLEPPFWVCCALVGCEGARLLVDPTWKDLSHAIDRAAVFLPETKIEAFDFDEVRHLRPMLDVLWNAAGQEKSLNYDEHGNRTPRQ